MNLSSPLPFVLQLDLPAKGPLDSTWSGGSYGIVLLLLVLLIGALAAAYLYVKRFGIGRQAGAGRLEVLETRPLGGRQYLVVGKYGRDTFLLGVCPGRIDFLTRLDAGVGEAAFEQLLHEEAADRLHERDARA